MGKRLRLVDPGDAWLEVVGVAKTVPYLRPAETPTPYLYQSFAQNPRTQMSLLIQTSSVDAAGISSPVRAAVRALDVNLPILRLLPFSTVYQERTIGTQLMLSQVVGTMGLLGLALALIGLYGLVSYSVTRRTREIGVRMAMGAARTDVSKMVVGEGFRLSLAGIGVGGIVSIAVSRLLMLGMAGLGSPNLVTSALIAIALMALTMAVSYLPARRAAAVDPQRALRYE